MTTRAGAGTIAVAFLCAFAACRTEESGRPEVDGASATGQAIVETPRPWTILLFAAVDNDWERDFLRDLRGLRRGLEGAASPEVLLWIDRSPKYLKDKAALGEDFADTRIYRLTGGAPERLDGEPEIAGMSKTGSIECNTGDPATLRDFVRFAKRHYPARHYALWIVSHGDGPYCCPDETDGDDELFTAELTAALAEEDSVDVFGFDACTMAAVENAYEWRREPGKFGADFLLAFATVSNSWPYEDIFRRLAAAPAPGPRELCALVVEETRRQIAEGRSGDRGLERDLQCIGAFDLAAVAETKRLLDALARQLWRDGAKAELLTLRGSGLGAETFVYVWPEPDANVSMPHVDLAHLCERIAASERFSAATRALAARAASAADAAVVASCGFFHYKGFVAGRHGLYVVFPEGDARTADGRTSWEAIPWYTPLRVKGVPHAHGAYAWCRDGATPGNGEVENWFELMDAWFDAATGANPGGVNGYAW